MLYLNLQDLRDKIAVSPTEAQIALEQAAEELDRIREEDIRNISHRLHPSVIKVSLAAGLRSLQDQFERSIRVELEIADEVAGMEPGEGSKIPLNVRLGFYRVAEEAMGNVIKHARATQISVKLCVPEGGGLRLAIEDNGRGFAPSESKGRSIGLATIRDHMAAIGGDFEIESAPGQGTKITATAPLKVAQAVARG
ncbi:MAG: ATP-binding protein [Chloroflexi bacterium]|nr:ATP-binding protein [Chloroflexota bacterium]